MSREWKEVRLEDIIEIEMGQSPKSEFYNKDGEGLPFLQGNRTFGERYPTFDTYCTDNKKVAHKDDVLMSVRAPVGDLNLAQTRISIGRGVCAMRLKNRNNLYLYYLLKNNINKLINRESGTVFGSVNKNDILGLKVLATMNSEEQKAIVRILSTLDEKIEVNNHINKKLEEMAQVIFKHWFIDFEFPNEDGKPYKSSGGEMVKSELGMIPKGWEVKDIEHVTEKANTGADAIRRAPIVDYETEIKCVRVGDLSQGRNISGWGFCEVSAEDFKRFQLKRNDIIITRTGTIGLNMFVFDDLPAVFNNGLIRLQIKEEYNALFIYQVINSKNYYDHINKITGETSTRPNMKINYLLKYKFSLPPKKVRNRFAEILSAITSKIYCNNNEIERITSLRDTILPKLMSGEIGVPLDN